MMKVWVLTTGDAVEGLHIEAVFSEEDQAKMAANRYHPSWNPQIDQFTVYGTEREWRATETPV